LYSVPTDAQLTNYHTPPTCFDIEGARSQNFAKLRKYSNAVVGDTV